MTDKKHILLMSSWYPTRVDPYSGNFVERFARLLSRDHYVTVVFTRSEDRKDLEIADTSDDFRTVVVYHPEGKGAIGKMSMQRSVAKIAFQQITRPVDLIFAHISWPKGLQFVQAKTHFKAPLLLLEHGSYYRPDKVMPFFQKMLVRRCLRSANAVAAVSEVLKSDMLRLFPGLQIEVIPNPVDAAVFRPLSMETGKQLVHISTLDRSSKHPEKIIEALKILKERSLPVTLRIISDQPFGDLQRLCEQLGIAELVTFAGPLSENEVSQELNTALALVVSSSYETFGIVIAEAWLCGKPVISTPVGIASQLDTKAGIQVTGTALSIADGIETLLRHPQQFAEQELVQLGMPFTQEHVGKLLNEKIAHLARKSRHHR